MTKFIDLTLNGVSTGAIYAAVGLALVLIWRATRIVNFAQGAMLMITTFIAWKVISSGGSYVAGFFVALSCGLVMGAAVERILIRRVESAPPLNAVIVTLGLLILLQSIAGMIWGNTPKSFPAAFSIRGYKVGSTTLLFAPNDLFIVLLVLGAAVALAVLFRFTPDRPEDARRRVPARGSPAAGSAGGPDAHAGMGAGGARGLDRGGAGGAIGVRRTEHVRPDSDLRLHGRDPRRSGQPRSGPSSVGSYSGWRCRTSRATGARRS